MEAENTSSWSSETNWTIADGSLVNSVTFESLVSPIDEGTVSTLKSPLLLHPPSPDSGPCEIKISFTQKHELRQVYVRSTARVYEIYYAPNLQSSNEYLCTVRCSIATKDEELLHATDIEEAVSAHLNGSNKQLAEEKSKSNSNTSTNEDDWVEVKVLDSPLLDSTNSSLRSKIDTNPGRSTQDFYEATAEIADVDPCISLTLRLLSLQNKECIYVDEVYVFADPVESADLENQVGRVENSAGSSLMAMLVPTLLQLSKTGNSRIEDKRTFDTSEKQNFQEIRSKATDSTNIANTIHPEGKSSTADQQELKLLELNRATAEPAQLQIPKQVSATESKPDSVAKEKDFPYNHIERALDQLFSRVGRIEDLFLRFEENMIKPISSIEARLQRVEQQLEVLTKNSQYSGFPSGTRFSAPEFSCNESGSNSFYNDGSDYPSCGALESDKKDISSDKLPIPPDDMSVSVNVTQLLPSLVVTAPEFLNGDDEEEIDASEPVTDFPREKPKKAVSIHDALASALAGFLSSTSIQPQKYTQTLAVKAPEFSNDEDGNDDKIASPRVQCEIAIDPSICLDKTDGIECIKGSVLTSCSVSSLESEGKVIRYLNDYHFDPSICKTDGIECIKGSVLTSSSNSSLESEGEVTRYLNDYHFEERAEGVDEGDQIYGGGEDNSEGIDIDYVLDPAKPDVARTDIYHITEDTIDREVSNGISKVLISDKTDVPNQFLGNQTDGNDLTVATDVTEEGSSKDILRNVLEFSRASSIVDFGSPILDVRFTSQENSITNSPLDALLAGMAEESNVEVPCVKESDNGAAIGEQSNLILVEDDGELMGPATCNHLFVDLDNYEMEKMTLNMEGDEVQDHYTCSSQEVFEASLI